MWQRVPDKKEEIKMKEVKVIDNEVIMKSGHKAAVEELKKAFINDYNKRLRGAYTYNLKNAIIEDYEETLSSGIIVDRNMKRQLEVNMLISRKLIEDMEAKCHKAFAEYYQLAFAGV
jgi:formylmethanofuran dehydrogenase subunit A